MEHNGPSLLKILLIDYLAQAAVIVLFVFWGLWAFDEITQGSTGKIPWLYIAAGASVIALVVLAWRLRSIYSVFEAGRQVEGTVTGVNFFRDRGRITFFFTLDGQRYEASTLLAKTLQTRKLGPGQAVTVLVDPDHPKAAILKDFFL